MPTGKILFFKEKGPSGWGFIVPDDGSGKREENIWFGGKAAFGMQFRDGDRVDYDPGNYRPGKGPSAARMRLKEAETRSAS